MVQEAVWKRCVTSAVLAACLVVVGCQRSPRQPPATPAASVATQGNAGGGTPALAGAMAQARPPAPAAPGQQPPPAPSSAPGEQQAARPLPGGITLSRDVAGQTAAGPRPPSTAAGLMALDRQKRILPEDFKIGPLGEARGGTVDTDAAIAAAEAFLASVVSGTPDVKLLAPDSGKAVSDTVTFGLQQGYTPKSFRVGTPKVRDDGEITATVRLFGADGTSEGEIYMSRVGKAWLVSDLQLSMAQLAVKKEKSKEKFFPSTYRWLLED
jgi:hypothetical protein